MASTVSNKPGIESMEQHSPLLQAHMHDADAVVAYTTCCPHKSCMVHCYTKNEMKLAIHDTHTTQC